MFFSAARTKKHLRYAFALGFIAVAAVWLAARDEHAGAGVRVQPCPVADFQWVDGDKQPFTRTRLQGHGSLLFFGYTHCPEVYPITMTELAK